MADDNETAVVPGRSVLPTVTPEGDVIFRDVPQEEAQGHFGAVPLTEDVQAQMRQAARWRQMRAEVDTGDVLEMLARESGMAWGRGAMLATPLMPWLGAAGYYAQQNSMPSSDQDWLEYEAARAEHPFLALLPTAGYDIGAAALTGGAAGYGEMVAQGVAERLGGGLGARMLANAGGLAIDGGVAAIQQAVQDSQLNDTDLTAEQVMAAGGMGAGIGGGLGLLFGPFMGPSRARQLARTARAGGSDAIEEARRLAVNGMRPFEPELGDPTPFTRGGSLVSRLDEPGLRRVAAWGALADEEVDAALAADRAAQRLETWLPEADREVSSVLDDTLQRGSYLRTAFRAGQEMAGVSDDVVGRHVFDTLQNLDTRWAQAAANPQGLTDVERTALNAMRQHLDQAYRDLGLETEVAAHTVPAETRSVTRYRPGSGPAMARAVEETVETVPAREVPASVQRATSPIPLRAEQAGPVLDEFMRRVRAIRNPGELASEVENATTTIRNSLGNEGVFGQTGRAYRQLLDATYEGIPGHARRTDIPISWTEARQRVRSRLSEGGTASGPLRVSGKRLRSQLAPGLGEGGVWQDIAEARTAYLNAAEAVRRLTGRNLDNLEREWADVASDLGEASVRARATNDKVLMSNFERRNAGAWAAAGLSGVGLGAVAGGMVGGPLGAIGGAGVGLAFAALTHPIQALSIMSHLGKLVQGTTNRTAVAVSRLGNVVRTGKLAGRIRRGAPAVPVVLARLHSRESRQKEYTRIVGELRHFAGNPQALQQHLETTFAPVASSVSATFATRIQVKTVNAIQYLVNALPTASQPGITLFPDATQGKPSDAEVKDFLVRYQVALDPISAVEDAASGNLTLEGAEALRVLYPALFQEVQVQMLDAMRDVRNPPFAVANQLSILMNTPADVTHTEQFVFRMQQSFAQTPAQDRAQHTRRGMVRISERTGTSSQSIEARLR